MAVDAAFDALLAARVTDSTRHAITNSTVHEGSFMACEGRDRPAGVARRYRSELMAKDECAPISVAITNAIRCGTTSAAPQQSAPGGLHDCEAHTEIAFHDVQNVHTHV